MHAKEKRPFAAGALQITSRLHRSIQPLAPYSRTLRQNESLIWVFAGPFAWDWARNDTRNKLVAPPGDDPAAYRWPVQGKDAVIIDTGSEENSSLRLAWTLLHSGALMVGLVPLEGRYTVFRQEARRHAG